MHPSVDRALSVGGLFKSLVMAAGSIVIIVFAILGAISGDWIRAALLFFVGAPIWMLGADIATGIIIAPFVGLAALVSRSKPTRAERYAEHEFEQADPALAALAEDYFEQAGERFQKIYASPDSPGTAGSDVDVALRVMVDGLGVAIDPNDPTSARLWRLGLGGYVWRLAEPHNAHFADPEIREQVVECASQPEERFLLLARAAIACLDRSIRLGLNSPGGWISGRLFLDAAFRWVFENIGESAEPTLDDRAAFMFGVALNDCERLYARYFTTGTPLERIKRGIEDIAPGTSDAIIKSLETSLPLQGENPEEGDEALSDLRASLEESYKHRYVAGAKCSSCHQGEQRLALQVIKFAQSENEPLHSDAIPMSASRGTVRGSFPVCEACAPPCEECGLPRLTGAVRNLQETLKQDFPGPDRYLDFGNGICEHELPSVEGIAPAARLEIDKSVRPTLDEKAEYIGRQIVDAELAERCKVDLAYVDDGARLVLIAVHTFGTEMIPVPSIEQLAREWLLRDA